MLKFYNGNFMVELPENLISFSFKIEICKICYLTSKQTKKHEWVECTQKILQWLIVF